MSGRLNIVYVWCLFVFSVMKNSILTIMYVFSFSLVFKLCKSGLQTMHPIPDHPTFFGSADIGSYLVVAYFERWILILGQFSDVFSDL